MFPDDVFEIQEAKFIKSEKGGVTLMDKADYIYYKQKVSGPKIHWDCRQRKRLKCKGRASTQGFNIIKLSEHNHPPDEIVHEEV